MNKRMIMYVFIITFIIVSTTSIGYGAFNSNFSISGDAIVRSCAEVRIVDVKLLSKSNGGEETYNSEFLTKSTSMHINLPNVNSSITYQVTIDNYSGKYFTPVDISVGANSNSNVNYSINGLESNHVYQGSSYPFTITFTTSLANQKLDITFNYDFKTISDNVWGYGYSGNYKTYDVLYNSKYRIEAWGAQGGSYIGRDDGGRGAYTMGDIFLNKGQKLHVYVGESGKDNVAGTTSAPTTFNGGGSCSVSYTNFHCNSGGGATDIRIVEGNWDNTSSLISRIMVAAGGGGFGYTDSTGVAGDAGGLIGYDASPGQQNWWKDVAYGLGATQTAGGALGNSSSASSAEPGSFGKGGKGVGGTDGGSGGGSGFYGGGGGYVNPSGGGSSYISGHTGCVAVSSISSSSPKSGCSTGSTNIECSKHPNGYYFINTKIIDGKGCRWTNAKGSLENMPNPVGGTYPSGVGNSGDGYVKISIIPDNI